MRDCFSLVSTMMGVLGFGQGDSLEIFDLENMFSTGFIVFYKSFSINVFLCIIF